MVTFCCYLDLFQVPDNDDSHGDHDSHGEVIKLLGITSEADKDSSI